MVVLGVGEVGSTAYYALSRKVPARTPGGMAWNAVLMLALGMWAFWLLARQ